MFIILLLRAMPLYKPRRWMIFGMLLFPAAAQLRWDDDITGFAQTEPVLQVLIYRRYRVFDLHAAVTPEPFRLQYYMINNTASILVVGAGTFGLSTAYFFVCAVFCLFVVFVLGVSVL